ncbi:MAG: dihydrolipoyllysine-residue acetyltransferase [Gammaproteobacteria bacterium]|nr:dihydrolipoyllysine-residue acetyltransferase [Gammaproteobacteria bacterium]
MTIKEIPLPDLGSSTPVTVIEIPIQVGDQIQKEDTLLTLEGEKASMDVPSPVTGIIKAIHVKLGDKVNTGHLIASIETSADMAHATPVAAASPQTPATAAPPPAATAFSSEETISPGNVHAGPAVRSLAKALDINLATLKGSGHKNRITKEDLFNHIKQAMTAGGSAFPKAPEVDFSQFGNTEAHALSRIKKWTATNLHRNWVLIPHVTQFDEADITDLEAYRKLQLAEAGKQGAKLTLLAFVMKACVAALRKFPQFNASLSPDNSELILKHYFHFGIAVDTPEGLVVPVIRDVDQKGLMQLAAELTVVSQKARDNALTPKDMQGSSFTISSLGGIGGTAFTPIINMPDVAILGLSRAAQKPVYQNNQFIPRLMLPLSLSYDHRVIDGAEGARFITYLSACLSDIRTVLL